MIKYTYLSEVSYLQANDEKRGISVDGATNISLGLQIHNGLTAIGNHELYTKLHGETVPPASFGIICQLIFNSASAAKLDRHIAHLPHTADLSITLGDLGIANSTDAQLRGVAKQSCASNETIWNMDTPINEDIMFNAIRGADMASKDWLKRTGKAKA